MQGWKGSVARVCKIERLRCTEVQEKSDEGLVPKGGLEPPRVAPYAPQTYVSTNSTTSAHSSELFVVQRLARAITYSASFRPEQPSTEV